MSGVLRTVFTVLVAVVLTVVFATIVLVAALLRVPDAGPRGLYARIPRAWSRAILWAAGVRVRLHGLERLRAGGPFIFTSNHVSLFDIPALVSVLPRHYFVAKAELFRIPVFGAGIRAVGTIPIERENRKAAFVAYDVAAERIRRGASVIVFPEGTRGTSYPIRPFRKGPFVLAVKAGVPVVPCVVHGTIEVLPKKSLRIHPGTVDVHVLEPVPTAELDYDDRDALAHAVRDRMISALACISAQSRSFPDPTHSPDHPTHVIHSPYPGP